MKCPIASGIAIGGDKRSPMPIGVTTNDDEYDDIYEAYMFGS